VPKIIPAGHLECLSTSKDWKEDIWPLINNNDKKKQCCKQTAKEVLLKRFIPVSNKRIRFYTYLQLWDKTKSEKKTK
jgi:hypothetical protein